MRPSFPPVKVVRMLLSMILTALPALATDPAPPPGPDAASTAPVLPKTRKFLMEVNFRGRYMFLPESVLDIWYEKHSGDGILERPAVGAYALGLEFVIKDKQANGIFYLEYISALMDAGYWDDRDSEDDFGDGTWIEPEGFGLVALGADYGYELKATSWLSFLFGAGLGLGIKTGDLVEWDPGEPEGTQNGNNTDPGCGPDKPSYERQEDCEDDGTTAVPAVIPMVDVNVGFRFNFSDRATLRIEGGLHDLPYAGAAVGIVF